MSAEEGGLGANSEAKMGSVLSATASVLVGIPTSSPWRVKTKKKQNQTSLGRRRFLLACCVKRFHKRQRRDEPTSISKSLLQGHEPIFQT